MCMYKKTFFPGGASVARVPRPVLTQTAGDGSPKYDTKESKNVEQLHVKELPTQQLEFLNPPLRFKVGHS